MLHEFTLAFPYLNYLYTAFFQLYMFDFHRDFNELGRLDFVNCHKLLDSVQQRAMTICDILCNLVSVTIQSLYDCIRMHTNAC